MLPLPPQFPHGISSCPPVFPQPLQAGQGRYPVLLHQVQVRSGVVSVGTGKLPQVFPRADSIWPEVCGRVRPFHPPVLGEPLTLDLPDFLPQ